MICRGCHLPRHQPQLLLVSVVYRAHTLKVQRQYLDLCGCHAAAMAHDIMKLLRTLSTFSIGTEEYIQHSDTDTRYRVGLSIQHAFYLYIYQWYNSSIRYFENINVIVKNAVRIYRR